ncbi:MAG: sodium-dependent transporter [Firmicutes bacterium]|nr:sodium-dependent transporter [Bacillota bacterium]
MDLNEQNREQWVSRVGFILAAAGSAIGLGNIWRFPYITGTGGGAVFLIVYLLAIFFIGYPIMVTEMTIGRKTQRNPIGAFKALAPNSPWWLVGALGVLSGFVILSYYSVVGGWSLAYIFKAIGGSFVTGTAFDELFIGQISATWGPIIWHFVFMAITIGIISAGVVKGIQKSVQILMPILFILLFVLVVRSLTLPGASKGVAFYLRPDFSLLTWRSVLNAVAQSFFTLSLGMGAMLTYGSYLSQKENIPDSALSVVGLDTLVAVLAGFAIFPAVFAFGFDPGAGAGLTFITLPAVFAEMPLGAFFGFLFFLLLSIAAVTSAISLLEVVVAYAVDELKMTRVSASIIIGLIVFVVGIPSSLGYSVLSDITFLGMDLLDTYDWISNCVFLPLGGLLTCIFAGYVWGSRNTAEEANKGEGSFKVGDFYSILLKVIVPIAIFIVMIFGILETLNAHFEWGLPFF